MGRDAADSAAGGSTRNSAGTVWWITARCGRELFSVESRGDADYVGTATAAPATAAASDQSVSVGMPNYTVRVWRPSIDAATPEEAAQQSIILPAVTGDEFYVLENDPTGSMNYVVGSAPLLGGAFPMPQQVFEGPDFTPVVTKIKL
jgi:hypothetical protein